MKTLLAKALPALLVVLTVACTLPDAQSQRRANPRNSTQRHSRGNEVDAKRKSSGQSTNSNNTVSPTTWEPDKEVTVTFNQFPTSLAEWKRMQEQFGTTPEGAVALQIMAFELYRNNRTDGEAALRLNNTGTNYNSTVERLKEIMGKDQYYARPYIARAMLQGATPENGYTVRPPYTISLKVDPNKKYQESQLLHGTVIYLLIYSKGWDTPWRGVEVVKPQGSDYYVVSNCPAMYTQCKEAIK